MVLQGLATMIRTEKWDKALDSQIEDTHGLDIMGSARLSAGLGGPGCATKLLPASPGNYCSV
jgi:hypothetical protein